MHHPDASSLLPNPHANRIDFVSPIVSAMLAADCSRAGIAARNWTFASKAKGYAQNVGLCDVLGGRFQQPVRGGSQGRTYSKLSRLQSSYEVDFCNTIVGELLRKQLEQFSQAIVGPLCKCVGELHDNVASHARGPGYSAAQVYDDGPSKRVEFAVADAGCGMLRNVQRARLDIQSDAESIRWCVGKGNTTAAASDDPFAQRLPDDSWNDPFPPGTSVFTTEDHHAGEGLWLLHEFVRASGGSLWICSGTGRYSVSSGGEPVATTADWHWQGVAVEFEIRVSGDGTPTQDQQAGLEDLARRLGLS